MAQTAHYNLRYPSDYTALADVPEAVKDLADDTDTTLYTIVGDIETALQTLNTGGGVE